MPPDVERKRFGLEDAGGPAAKGDARAGKAGTRHNRGKEEPDRFAGDGAEADAPPGEEELEQDELREGKSI